MAHRIDHATRVVNKNGAGKDGFGEGQTTPTPIAATVVTEAWLNDIQENIAQAIEGAGATLVKGSFGQLLSAISALIFRSAVRMALSNWRSVTMTAAQSPVAVCAYDGGASDSVYGARFVAVTTGGYILESSGPLDMIGGLGNVAWTAEANFSGQNLNAVAASSTTRVAAGNSGVVLKSTVAGTWSSYTYPLGNYFYGVCWSGLSLWIVVGDSETIITSPDATTWTSRRTGTNTLRAVTSSASLAVAVGDAGTILTSANGTSWTARTSGTSNALYGVAWTGTMFVAVGAAGTVLTSPDGVTWTARTSGVSVPIKAVAAGLGIVVAACDPTDNTDPAIIYSFDDGFTWSASPVNVGAGALTGIAIHPRQREFCVVGPSGSFRSLRIPS